MKRGQVTVFVLAGFIIVIALALLFTAAAEINSEYSIAKKNKFIADDYNEGFVRSQVNACIEGIVEGASYLMGGNAGYLSCLTDSSYAESGAGECVYVNSTSIPVMLDEDGTYFLPKEEVEKRICAKLHVDLNTCFDKTSIESTGVDILSQDLGGSVVSAPEYCKAFLDDKSFVVIANYSIFIAKENFQSNISNFIAKEKLPVWYLMQNAEEFAKFIEDNSFNNSINLSTSCISHPDFSIAVDEEVVTFTYLPQVSVLPFVFQFGYKDYNIVGQC